MEQDKIVIYQTPDGQTQIDVKLENETVWLTQAQMGLLFGTKKAAISKHIHNIYATGELEPTATVSKMETVRLEGKRVIKRTLEYFNLDMILSVGYRVNSKNAIAFRRWSSTVLKQYISHPTSSNTYHTFTSLA